MPPNLDDFSADDLLLELRAREQMADEGDDARDEADHADDGDFLNPELADVDTDTLAGVLNERQKVIYGVDNRKDVFEINDADLLKDADCVVALFEKSAVRDNGDGTSTLQTEQFGTRLNLCNSEPFRKQPTGAFCSGFLVAPDIVVTAGHCVSPPAVTDIRFVFGFRMVSATQPPGPIPNSEIYRGQQVLGRRFTQGALDWAVVRLDRRVTGHRPAPVRRRRRVGQGAKLHVIGHPVGLPTKIAGGAIVRNNTPAPFFLANLDTYGGNSGSPVFNSRTHRVEGILVRGERDFVSRGNCTVSFVCPNTGCRGEDVTRITKLVNLIPPAP